MAERLGLGLIQIDPQLGAGWRAGAIREVARAAEDAGFETIFCAEVNNDSMAAALLMGMMWCARCRSGLIHPRHRLRAPTGS